MNQDTTPRISKEIKRLQAFAAEIRGNGFQVTLPLSTPISRHALTLERIRIVLSSAILDEINETIDRLQALAEYNQDVPEEAPFLPGGTISGGSDSNFRPGELNPALSEVVIPSDGFPEVNIVTPDNLRTDRAVLFMLNRVYIRDATDDGDDRVGTSFYDYCLIRGLLK